MRLEPWCRKR